MLFNSFAFLLFFPAACLVYFAIPTVRLRNLFLLAASYYFYMNWEPAYALLLLSGTLITYVAAIGIDRCREASGRRACLVGSLVLNLAILFLFKYYNFAAESLTGLLAHAGLRLPLPHFGMLLPVGISFYTFQALGYSIDVYRRTTPVERNFFTYALFVSFFPQLVAGPIERSNHLLPQFGEKHRFDYDRTMAGVRMMLWGFFLKLALADRCGTYVDAVFNNVAYHNGSSFAIASLLFPFQIYGDFAGYSLVAIGAAKVMGFTLMENFRRPYFAVSVTEFWRRWHISLSTWFKDYIYIPLGGNRVGRMRGYANLLITFGISGLWHGASWTFVVWGLLHGVILCAEKTLGFAKAQYRGLRRFCHWLLTFCVVCVAWVFFRAASLGDALTVLAGMATDLGVPFLQLANFFAIAMAMGILVFKECKDEFGWDVRIASSPSWLLRHLYIALAIAYLILFGVLNGDQFIYFQF